MASVPGQPDFIRGPYPSMYRSKFWTMRQYGGFGTAKETNARFKELIASGQTGLSVAFDLPTQLGYDSDHLLAKGEVGKVGVPICSLADMEELFEGIDLGNISTSMTINSTAIVLLAMYVAVAKKKKVSAERISGTVQNDILKEYFARGTYIYPPEFSLRLASDIIEYSAKHLVRFNPISISGYHMREAGCTAAEELAYTFANAICYVQEVQKKGILVDAFAPRLSFFFACHSDFFEEIAKFRAARHLWWWIATKRFGAKIQESSRLRFHVQTGGWTLAPTQVENNLVRVTYQALSAVLGGCQSLHTNSKDEALGLPTSSSAQTALRTQQIIAYETGIGDVVDPLGGSPYVEALTQKMISEAKQKIEELLSQGGSLTAVTSGSISRSISDNAYKTQKAIDSKERKIVGVNCYTSKEKPQAVFKIHPKHEKEQRAQLVAFKKKRNMEKVMAALNLLEKKAVTSENLFPYVLAAVESLATVGEISDVFRKKFGEFVPPHGL